ncbi:MAG: redoxin domain-containing protein [Candidatus Sulfotelmatobacter sp.]
MKTIARGYAWKLCAVLMLSVAAPGQRTHPVLAIGSPAPNFELPGVDGAIHKLADYSASPILVVIFTCNHCPIAQMYERRIAQLASDYKDRGVSVVAIEPNDPKAITIDELDSSDISDSLAEMKIRAEYKHLTYPYLYDGESQSVTDAYGPQATPHAFVFDRGRRLRYEGRVDNSYRSELVTTHEVRDAIDALLAHREVAVKHTGVFGCSTKWKEKHAAQLETLRKIESQPVQLEMVSAAGLKKLRSNPDKKMLLVSFWATWCGSCIHEFPDVEDTFRMYSLRDFELVTVAANMPDEKVSVMRILEKMHATSRNLLFDSNDTATLQAAFDPKWESAVPYTVLVAPDGKVLYQKQGSIDILELRRTILANLPSDYEGFNRYWSQQ